MTDDKPKTYDLSEFASKQAKGGKARAAKLSKAERSDIAAKAAGARWGGPRATHEGPLKIGDMELDTAVLDNGMRVITQGRLMEALGMYYSGWLSTNRPEHKEGDAETPYFLAHKALQPHVDKHLGSLQSAAPVKFRTLRGAAALGIKAELLPKICEIWLDARKTGGLGTRMEQIADKSEILLRGFAQVGIVALIDEATGYQAERHRGELQELLQLILSDELSKWAKTFPATYFKEMCRLRGVPFRSDMRLPQYFGHLTNDVVYDRITAGLLSELQKRNPRTVSGRKHKHHQHFDKDIGHPMLLQHLGMVIGVMKLSDGWDDFKEKLDRVAPPREDLPLFNKLQDSEN